MQVDLASVRNKRFAKLLGDWGRIADGVFDRPPLDDPEKELDEHLRAGERADFGGVLVALDLKHRREYVSGVLALRAQDPRTAADWFSRCLASGYCHVVVQRHLYRDLGRSFSAWRPMFGGDLCARMLLVAAAGRVRPVCEWAASYVLHILKAGGSACGSVHAREDDQLFRWLALSVTDAAAPEPQSLDSDWRELLRSEKDSGSWKLALEKYCDVRISKALHYERPTDERPAGNASETLYWMELFPDSLFPVEIFALRGIRALNGSLDLMLNIDHPLLTEFASGFPMLTGVDTNRAKGDRWSALEGIRFDEQLVRVLELARARFKPHFSIDVPAS